LQAFSTSSPKADVAKMTLVGRLVSDGLVRTNKNGKEFLVYKVVTTDPYVPPKEGGESGHAWDWL
jgi:single-stranded DNA-binding protein